MKLVIIRLVTIIIVSVLCIVFVYKRVKKSKTVTEKSLYLLLLFTYFIPYIIYIFDRYNIPAKLGYLNNLNSDKWFSFISNYISTIVGTIVSGVILILITLKQITIQKDNDKESKRIENAPIFKYDLSSSKIENSIEIFMFNGEGNTYNLFLTIENIGLNHARDIKFLVEGDNINPGREFGLDSSQSILKKDNSVSLELVFNYKAKKSNNKKNIKISITYEDFLNNKYIQNINIVGEVTNVFGFQYGGNMFNILKCEIENEKLLKKSR